MNELYGIVNYCSIKLFFKTQVEKRDAQKVLNGRRGGKTD